MPRSRKPDSERTSAVSVALSGARRAKLDRAAKRLGKSRSEVVGSLVDRLHEP